MFANREAHRGLNCSNNPIIVISSPVIDSSVRHEGVSGPPLLKDMFPCGGFPFTQTRALSGLGFAPRCLSSAPCLFIVEEQWMFILSPEQNKPARSVRPF